MDRLEEGERGMKQEYVVVAVWWLVLALLVIGSVRSTIITFQVHAREGDMIDQFSEVIEEESGKLVINTDTIGGDHPLAFHKDWHVRHSIIGLGLKFMVGFYTALAVFLGVTLLVGPPRIRQEPGNTQETE